MKQQMIDNISEPGKLEQLYRKDPRNFEKHFYEIAGDYNSSLMEFWKIRLAPTQSFAGKGFQWNHLIEVMVVAACTAILMLIPAIFPGINRESFYLRNLSLIAFNGLILYSFRLNKYFEVKQGILYGLILVITVLYVNLLPTGPSDTVVLALVHVPLMFWCYLGLTWLKFDFRSLSGKIDFVRFNGELVIMTGLILLAGGVLTVITLGLFSVIGMEIMPFYSDFIAIPGGVAAPIIAWYLIRNYPDITSKIAPVIAKVFTPVVLVTLAVYLVSLIFTKNNILENRELLIVFNVMLLGVLALIIFSVSGIDHEKTGKNNLMILFLLSVLAIIINSIALVAIISRTLDGLTPNRAAVLITNILVFVNLILIAVRLYRSGFRGAPTENIEKSVAGYLTVYAAWTVIAVYILPMAFGFR